MQFAHKQNMDKRASCQNMSGRGGFHMRKDRCLVEFVPRLILARLMTVLQRHGSQLPLCRMSLGCGIPDVLKKGNLIKPG